MISSPDNNQLDNFIREALKTPDANLRPVDWSEVEVLLRHEQEPISFRASKKTILTSVIAAVILIAAFGIFKIANYYSSLPAETETAADSTQNTFSAVADTQLTVNADSLVSEIDSVMIDSIAKVNEKRKADSAAAVIASDTAASKKTAEKQKEVSAKIPLKDDKKDKTNTTIIPVDTPSVKTTVPPPDTVKIVVPQEIKKETLPAADTANKNIPAPKKNSKSKKEKSQKADSLPP